MPIQNEAKQALVACRVLEHALTDYLRRRVTYDSFVSEIVEMRRASNILLAAILDRGGKDVHGTAPR